MSIRLDKAGVRLNIDFRCLYPARTCLPTVFSAFELSTQLISTCSSLDLELIHTPTAYVEGRFRSHVQPTPCIVLLVYESYVAVIYGSVPCSNATPSAQVGPEIYHVWNC